jgi:Uma2 family endonuclease
MGTTLRWTSADLEVLHNDDKRYEIIDGDLYVPWPPGYHHQYACSQLNIALGVWSNQTNVGVTLQAPGVIFADDDDVVPDVVWISHERLATALDQAGHLHTAPELVVEVLSPGSANERRDREVKLKLYSRRGVSEYWIVDWQQRKVEVYQRQQMALQLLATLYATDTLTSPLLPGFACPVVTLFDSLQSLPRTQEAR